MDVEPSGRSASGGRYTNRDSIGGGGGDGSGGVGGGMAVCECADGLW